MPITANFQADFTSFSTAVAAATTKLITFEDEAKKVAGSLSAMERSISGVPIMQAATVAAEAVARLGGASKLTYAELQRLGGTAQEAVEKMRALGQGVPTGIQDLADRARGASEEMSRLGESAKTTTKAHEGLSASVRGLATDFLAMFTVRAAYNFVKDVLDDASALKDLSQQTHMSVEELQVLAGGMSEFGVDADELGKGLFKLSRGIAGEDDSVAHGLHLMGLSLTEVKGLNGQDLFLKMMDGLAKLQGGLRDTASAELFGGRLGSAMAGASEGIRDAIEKWQRLNTVASTESVNAMDEFGESIARANKNIASIAANMIGPLAQGFNVLVEASNKGASKWDLFKATFKDFAASSSLFGASTSNLTDLLVKQQKEIDLTAVKTAALAATHGQVTKVVDQRTQAEKFLAALERDAAVSLSAEQIKNLERLQTINQLNAKNAEGIGVSAAQFAKYTQSLKDREEQERTLAKTLAESDAMRMTAFANQIKALETMAAANAKAYGSEEQIAALQRLDAQELALTKSVYENITSEKERMKLIEQYGAKHAEITAKIIELEGRRTKVVNDQVVAELEAQAKLNAAYGLTASGGIAQQETAYTKLQKALDDLHAKKVEGISQTNQENLLYKEYYDATNAAAKASDTLRDAEGRKNAEVAKVPGLMAAAEAATKSYSASNAAGGSTGGSFQAPSFGGYLKPVQSFSLPSYADGGVGNFGAGTLALLHGLEAIVPLDKMPAAPTNESDLQQFLALVKQQQAAMYNLNFARTGSVSPPLLTGELTADALMSQNAKLVQQFYAEKEERRRTAETGGGPTVTVNVTQPLGTPSQIADVVGKAVMQSLRNQGVRFPSGA